MKVARVGAGISGQGRVWLLKQRHQIMVFDAGEYISGRPNSLNLEAGRA